MLSFYFLEGWDILVLDVLNLLKEMNDHQKATAGNVKAVSCSLPRAG